MFAVKFGILCLPALLVPGAVVASEAGPSFEREIGPLMQARCLKCHSGPRAKGELDLSSRARLLAGGASGAVVTPGKSSDSLLFDYVRAKKMPPKQPLSE
jgi:hypothetical protein